MNTKNEFKATYKCMVDFLTKGCFKSALSCYSRIHHLWGMDTLSDELLDKAFDAVKPYLADTENDDEICFDCGTWLDENGICEHCFDNAGCDICGTCDRQAGKNVCLNCDESPDVPINECLYCSAKIDTEYKICRDCLRALEEMETEREHAELDKYHEQLVKEELAKKDELPDVPDNDGWDNCRVPVICIFDGQVENSNYDYLKKFSDRVFNKNLSMCIYFPEN